MHVLQGPSPGFLETSGKPQWFPNQLRGSSQGWTRGLGCLIRDANPSLPPGKIPKSVPCPSPSVPSTGGGQVLTRPDCFSSLPASLCAVLRSQPRLKKSHLATSQINFTKHRSICSCGFDVLVREGEPASFYSILLSPLQVRFFTVDAPIYILTNNVRFPFLYIVTNACYVLSF